MILPAPIKSCPLADSQVDRMVSNLDIGGLMGNLEKIIKSFDFNKL